MTRFLSFILIDYLRYIKSPLIQDEGIESNEMTKILNVLSISISTITSFQPKFIYQPDDNFTLFKDDNKMEKRSNFYDSFHLFIKNSEHFISEKYFSKILQMSIERALKYDSISCSSLFEYISHDKRIESYSPLPNLFRIRKVVKSKYFDNRIVGFIPILLSSIPEGLESIKCDNRRLRISSDKGTYFHLFADNDITIEWRYKSNENNNYYLKFGLFTLSKDLPESLLNSLGIIQILYNIFQSFSESDIRYD